MVYFMNCTVLKILYRNSIVFSCANTVNKTKDGENFIDLGTNRYIVRISKVEISKMMNLADSILNSFQLGILSKQL